jgi:DNA polymerase
MNKKLELEKLKSEILSDKSLPLLESNLVFGEGNPDCEVLFIGEAPGLNEDRLQRPFVGRGGQLLNQTLEKINLKREDVYITNIVKRRPPENRDPLPEEIEAYKPYLSSQITIIDPKIIVTLGRFSMNYFLPEAKITRDHGQIYFFPKKFFNIKNNDDKKYIIFPILHPAAVLRSPQQMGKLFDEDFVKLSKILKKFPQYIKETFKLHDSSLQKNDVKKDIQKKLF